jgi:hypothetical protein
MPIHTQPNLMQCRRMTVAMLLVLSLGATNAQVTTQVEWQRCIGGSGFDDPGPGFTRTDRRGLCGDRLERFE